MKTWYDHQELQNRCLFSHVACHPLYVLSSWISRRSRFVASRVVPFPCDARGRLLRMDPCTKAEGPDEPEDAEHDGVDPDHPDEAKGGSNRVQEPESGKQ
jgi:hypothetical protein